MVVKKIQKNMLKIDKNSIKIHSRANYFDISKKLT